MTTPEAMYGDECKLDIIQIVTVIENRGPTSSQNCRRSDKTLPDIYARKDTHVNKHSLESGHGTLSDYTSHAPLKNLKNWKRTMTQKANTDSSVAIGVDDQVMRVIQERYN